MRGRRKGAVQMRGRREQGELSEVAARTAVVGAFAAPAAVGDARVWPAMEPRDQPVVFYDAQCAFCTRGAARLARLAGGRVALETLQVAAVGGAVAGEMKLLVRGGRVFGGAEAVARALGQRPVWRLLVWVYFVPGLRQLADRLYRTVARRRHCAARFASSGRAIAERRRGE